jgi:Kef-type K+ transport system membrane component KefB
MDRLKVFALPNAADAPFLALALGALLAVLAGELFWRVLRLPRITGYTLGGLLVGPSGFSWVAPELTPTLDTLVDLALGLLLFELGTRVQVVWFRTNKMLLACSLLESLATFVACTLAMLGFKLALPHALLIGALAVGTSPAIIMRIAAETRAQGQVSERMLALTAANTILSVVLVKLIAGFMPQAPGSAWLNAVGHAAYLLFGSLIIGALMAWAFGKLRRFCQPIDEHGIALMFTLLLTFFALLHVVGLPPLLAPLLAGIVLRNTDPRPLLLPRHFGSAGGLLVVLLFILNGVSIQWEQLFAGGLAALTLIAVRTGAKLFGVLVTAPRSGIGVRQALALVLTLTPFSATAVVLTNYLQLGDPLLTKPVLAIAISAVVFSELVCPILVLFALRICGETREEGR